MTTLLECRNEIKTIISANIEGVNFFTYLPGNATPDAAIVMPGSPYIEQGETFNYKSVRFKILLITKQGTNETETNRLDDLIASIAIDLEDANWLLEDIEEPAIRTLGDLSYLSTQLNIKADILLTKD